MLTIDTLLRPESASNGQTESYMRKQVLNEQIVAQYQSFCFCFYYPFGRLFAIILCNFIIVYFGTGDISIWFERDMFMVLLGVCPLL